MNHTHPPTYQALASRMLAAFDSAQTLAPLAARYPGLDMPAAYAVAHALHQQKLARGARHVGRKIGFTNADMWARYGVHQPIWGAVYEHSVVHCASEVVHCSLGAFMQPKIEPEIVFQLKKAPAPGASLPEVLACIDQVAHGFEIVQSPYPDWKFEAADAVCAGSLHAALYIGPACSVAELGLSPLALLQDFGVALFCDGQAIEQGQGSKVLGNPVAALAHLATLLANQPNSPPLQPGEWITTGTLTAAYPVRAGQAWHTTLQGIRLPGLRLNFTD
jgi:2-keto-4-pentenoate hydratase